jgi:hypothetical protein
LREANFSRLNYWSISFGKILHFAKSSPHRSKLLAGIPSGDEEGSKIIAFASMAIFSQMPTEKCQMIYGK